MGNWLSRAGLAAFAMATACLYGCGGASGGGSSVSSSTSLSGTAAIGAPISGTVVAVDVNGKVSPPASTSALGAFIVDVSGMTAPYFLNIVGTANGKQVTLNSVATAVGQTVNITPLTDLIVSISSGQVAGSALANLCAPVNGFAPAACLNALKAAATSANLASAVTAVKAMIQPINTSGVDPLNGTFAADGTGLDKVLDQILVAPADAQGAQATITLIATNSSLGTATLPLTAGQPATTNSTPPPANMLATAARAATVLPEIRTCISALNNKYTGTALTDADVSPFVDASFHIGAQLDKSAFLPNLKAVLATPGFAIRIAGLSPVNMEPLSAGEIASFIASTNSSTTPVSDFVATRATLGPIAFDAGTGLPTTAWVQIETGSDLNNWKMIKTTDTSGCAGGWKLAGNNHVATHMNARISRNIDSSGNATYARYWAFHANVDNVTAEDSTINQIDVRGAGLTTFGLFSTDGVNAAGTRLRLKKPTNGVNTVYQITDRDPSGNTTPFSAFYGLGDALQSCQDLAAAYPSPTVDLSTSSAPGRWTPCVDETKVSPGKLRVWTLRASGTEVRAFLSQVSAVPISKAFAIANAVNVFPTLSSTTPASVSALNALSGTLLDNLVTFNYTQGSAYGSKMDNCGLYVWNGGTQVLSAEAPANGKETSCVFSTSSPLNSVGSNAGGLFKFSGTVTDAYIGLTASVLGNQAGSSQPLSH